jgi:hypothetical protein
MPRLASETIGTGDQSWLGSTHGLYNARSVTPDASLFTLAAYPNGVPSGTPLGLVTASGKVGPYTGDSTDEVQTVTEGGSGLTSFTLTYSGQTTASLLAAATAAQVQSALEALSNIGVGDVIVTGSAGGPYTVTFGGALANTNVAQMTATPTGGTGTVTVATTTAGGADASSDGREVLAGFLVTDQKSPGSAGWPMLDHGRIRVDKLPITFAKDGHNTTGQFVFITSTGA